MQYRHTALQAGLPVKYCDWWNYVIIIVWVQFFETQCSRVNLWVDDSGQWVGGQYPKQHKLCGYTVAFALSVSNSMSVKDCVLQSEKLRWHGKPKPWRQQRQHPPTRQLVRSARTWLITRGDCHVFMHSASNVFKACWTTCHREKNHRVLRAEKNFRFHQMELTIFHVTFMCSSWSIRWTCVQVLAISTKISGWSCTVMTVMRTSVLRV